MHRRRFLKTSSAAALAAALPKALPGIIPSTLSAAERESELQRTLDRLPNDIPDRKALTQCALDAARSAGATYADVQIRLSRRESWNMFRGTTYPAPTDEVVLAMNVRALVNGYWGFAGVDAVPTLDNMASLGREAVAQAKTGALGKPRVVELAPTPVVPNGNWVMPVEIDPFTVDRGEKVDFMLGIADYVARRTVGVGIGGVLDFVREDRTFASSEGSFITQRVYTTSGNISYGVEYLFLTERDGQMGTDFAGPAGAGWELILRAPYQERADALIENARRKRTPKPVDIGRHDIVFDANAMAKILSGTIGEGTRLDRAMGYQANFEGTSFLNEPVEMLGTFQMGAPRITVTANRSMKGGCATVKWDGEGVEPEEITLVKDGMLHDFQTSRESASWLADAYRKAGRPVRSNGCAGSAAATTPMSVEHANLVLQPGAGSETFESLVASTKKGLAVVGGRVSMDQQCLNGAGAGDMVREIVDGKLGDVVVGSNYLLRAPEFWKKVAVLGGKDTARTFGFSTWTKYGLGSMTGGWTHSVSAVPAKVTEVAIIDVMRKGA